jgi:hypothetical protein
VQTRDFDVVQDLDDIRAPRTRQKPANSHSDAGKRQQTVQRIAPDCVQRPAGRRFVKSDFRLLRSLAGVE